MGRNADTHIRVREATWQELNRKKAPGESFDDVIVELLAADAADDADDDDGGGRVEPDGGPVSA
jgi:hypothetical protein